MKKTFKIAVVKTEYCFINVEAKTEQLALKKVEELIDNEEIDEYLDVNSTEYEVEEELIEELENEE